MIRGLHFLDPLGDMQNDLGFQVLSASGSHFRGSYGSPFMHAVNLRSADAVGPTASQDRFQQLAGPLDHEP